MERYLGSQRGEEMMRKGTCDAETIRLNVHVLNTTVSNDHGKPLAPPCTQRGTGIEGKIKIRSQITLIIGDHGNLKGLSR